MNADYGGIIAAVAGVLKADATLTGTSGLLANYGPTGATPSRANSVFYPEPPADRVFPCITLWDLATGAALPRQHDTPMTLVRMSLQISVWGASQSLRPICTEIDTLLETAYRAGAMDTAQWQFNDIDTRGPWHTIAVPRELTGGSVPIEQRAKVFVVVTANKTL
ncbi:MAG TPA: hypothetical protein VFW87_09030 [Pirellulales bacterium]|nr:hypothetical protein [Pirellulales bacterium]